MWQGLDSWLDQLNIKIQNKKDRYLRPILFCFKKVGLTANIISTLKVILAGVAMRVADFDVPKAMIIFLAIYILDVFDGSLARYMGQQSDRGKFIDVFTDQIIYSLVVLTLIRIDFLDIKVLAFNLMVVPVVYLLVVIQRNEDKTTDWIIKPVAKLNYYKTPFLAAVAGMVIGIFGLHFVYVILYITNILVSLHIVYAYIKIAEKKRRWADNVMMK